MTDSLTNQSEYEQGKTLTFADFCHYRAWKSCMNEKGKAFVGVKFGKERPDIYFPMGYRQSEVKPSEVESLDEECKQDFRRLMSVLSDKRLRDYFSREELGDVHLEFPFYAFYTVLQYYLNNGYLVEAEIIYKKGTSGKICWPRTIKNIKPQVVEDKEKNIQIAYLDLITRHKCFKDDFLITLIHKYCVYQSAGLIGPLYGVSKNDVENPNISLNCELFENVIREKISVTYSDKQLELFQAMLQIVHFFDKKNNCGNGEKNEEALFGVDKFDRLWEGMVDKIFGTDSRDSYEPHILFMKKGARGGSDPYTADDESDDSSNASAQSDTKKRSTLQPDTIMQYDGKVYVLDSKYYKYGVELSPRYLPGSESVCKQMAYAEYVEKEKNVDGMHVHNVFLMPYCADADNQGLPKDRNFEKRMFKMRLVGNIYGDWKETNSKEKTYKPYHKIACVLLDVKSVMEKYTYSLEAQKDLAKCVDGK